MRFSYRLVLAYTVIYQLETGMVYTCIYGHDQRNNGFLLVYLLGLCFQVPVESCWYTLPTYSKTHSGAASAKRYILIELVCPAAAVIQQLSSQPAGPGRCSNGEQHLEPWQRLISKVGPSISVYYDLASMSSVRKRPSIPAYDITLDIE
jgi:hypothetical protein